MTGFRKILSNSGWLAGEQLIRLTVGLFVGVWIARHLGPPNFGALSFALSFTSLIGVLGTLGLSRIVVRELALRAGDDAFRDRLLSSVFALRILGALSCFLISTGISYLGGQGDTLLIGIVSFGTVFSAFEVIDQHYQARSHSRRTVVARSLAFFIVTGAKIVLLINDASVVAFAAAAAFEVVASAFALYGTYRLEGLSLTWRSVDLRYGSSLLKESWPEIMAGFACLVFMRIDQVMLGNLIGAEAVGVYSVASRLAEAWYFIPTALVASSFPAIVRQREADPVLYLKRIRQLMAALMVIAYSAATIVTIFAEWAVMRLYGPAYGESAGVLIILVWCGAFVSLGVASGSWIMAERRPVINLTRNVLGAIINVALNLVLIPRYGVLGAAYGTLISQFVAYFACDFITPITRPIGKLKFKSLLIVAK